MQRPSNRVERMEYLRRYCSDLDEGTGVYNEGAGTMTLLWYGRVEKPSDFLARQGYTVTAALYRVTEEGLVRCSTYTGADEAKARAAIEYIAWSNYPSYVVWVED